MRSYQLKLVIFYLEGLGFFIEKFNMIALKICMLSYTRGEKSAPSDERHVVKQEARASITTKVLTMHQFERESMESLSKSIQGRKRNPI